MLLLHVVVCLTVSCMYSNEIPRGVRNTIPSQRKSGKNIMTEIIDIQL